MASTVKADGTRSLPVFNVPARLGRGRRRVEAVVVLTGRRWVGRRLSLRAGSIM
jgi:hypothetical protein